MSAVNSPGKQVAAAKRKEPAKSLVARFAGKLGVEPEKMLATLRATAFKTGRNDKEVTNEEMLALLVVADQYHLNPFTREIYAFRDQKGGIMPIIGVDGWVRMMQEQAQFDGVEFKYPEDSDDSAWVECTIVRKDRNKPFTVREYLIECQRDTAPWRQSPRRMLRHRALIQCIRIAFGFGGVWEPDEGEAIALAAGVDLLPMGGRTHVEAPQSRTAEEPFITDEQLEEVREKLAKTGVPDNLVLAKFEVGDLPELKFSQVPLVLKFIQDNAP
jgi:phage recombination protein Bet